MEAWVSPSGKDVYLDDIISALDAAAALLTRELEYNQRITENTLIFNRYNFYREIIVLLRNKFEIFYKEQSQ